MARRLCSADGYWAHAIADAELELRLRGFPDPDGELACLSPSRVPCRRRKKPRWQYDRSSKLRSRRMRGWIEKILPFQMARPLAFSPRIASVSPFVIHESCASQKTSSIARQKLSMPDGDTIHNVRVYSRAIQSAIDSMLT